MAGVVVFCKRGVGRMKQWVGIICITLCMVGSFAETTEAFKTEASINVLTRKVDQWNDSKTVSIEATYYFNDTTAENFPYEQAAFWSRSASFSVFAGYTMSDYPNSWRYKEKKFRVTIILKKLAAL